MAYGEVAVYPVKVEDEEEPVDPRLRLPSAADIKKCWEYLRTVKRTPPNKLDKLRIAYLLWTSRDDTEARLYIDARNIGPILNSELIKWKSTLHILLDKVINPTPRRKRQREHTTEDAQNATDEDQSGNDHMQNDDKENLTALFGPLDDAEFEEKSVAMTPKLFVDVAVGMTQHMPN
jgi:hypothetical protein